MTALRRLLFAEMIALMPPKAQRTLTQGEWLSPGGQTVPADADREVYFFQCVLQLVAYGWADGQIEDLFLSNLPLRAVRIFRETYNGNETSELRAALAKIREDEKSHGHVLPRLLDPMHLLHGRALVPTDPTPHPCIESDLPEMHQLANFAQDLYDGRQTGHYLAPVAMGHGKTRGFMLPFVRHCAQTSPDRGVIVAVERRKEAQQYADAVNEAVGYDVAFALYGHDLPCPKTDCQGHSTDEWYERSNQFAVLFLTHEMLARRNVKPYRRWAGGERVLCIIDEAPSAWWLKGSIDREDLAALAACPELPDPTLRAIEITHALLTGKRREIKPGEVPMPPYTPLDEEAAQVLAHLHLLSRYGGRLVGGTLLVARKALLPEIPTLILDATGLLDTSYPSDVRVLDVETTRRAGLLRFGDVELPATPINKLFSWDRTVGQGTLNDSTTGPEIRTKLVGLICNLLASAPEGEQVYVIGCKGHKEAFRDALRAALPDAEFARLLFYHYGETRGSNEMREAGTVVFTSLQHKGEDYYRNLAWTTGNGNPEAAARRIKRARKFDDTAAEEAKIRDQLITVLQEIGRTRLREGEPVRIFLPWADRGAREAVKRHLGGQFHAKTVEWVVPSNPTKAERLLATVSQPGTGRKQDLAADLGVKKQRMTKLLEKISDDLWGLHTEEPERDVLTTPADSPTRRDVHALLVHCREK